jgi:hypothetical protein
LGIRDPLKQRQGVDVEASEAEKVRRNGRKNKCLDAENAGLWQY